MGVDADLFNSWKQRPPAFLAHIDTGQRHGSAVQVNAFHVVTCAHVFGEDGEDFYGAGGHLPSVIQRPAVVRAGSFIAEGVVVAQHKSLDLALVRLSKARTSVAPPPLCDESYLGAACAAGIRHEAERLECLQQQITIESNPAWSGDLPIQLKYDYGSLEGTSGGGVFAVRARRLVLVGIVYLGGQRARMGALIPSQAVLDFLQKELDFKNPAVPAGEYEASLVSDGIVPALEFEARDYPLKLAFAAIAPKANRPGGTVSFLSHRPIAASEMRLETPARVMAGHRRLAAWADSIGQADGAIQVLGRALGLKLRLPTPEELTFSWRAPASVGKAPEGRPLTLADFRPNELRMHLPPAGVYELARDRSGNAWVIEAGAEPGGMQAFPDSQVDAIAPCFRVAFDAEGL